MSLKAVLEKTSLFAAAAVVALIVSVFTGCPVAEMKKEIESITISMPDIAKAADGKYLGSHDTALIKAGVEIEIYRGRIVSARLLRHECGLGKKAEAVLGNVVEKQSVEVDAIAGATGSSRVILKAAEKALLAAEGKVADPGN